MFASRMISGLATLGAGSLASVGGAFAQEEGAPDTFAHDWQLGFQESVTPLMDSISSFHDHLLLPIITVITLFVLGLLLICIVRFNARRNPTPSKASHNTLLEVMWTALPILILVVIAIPSFRLLYDVDRTADADMTLKVIGHQWYWSYEYPDHGNFAFDALMIEDANLQPGQPRLLTTDNAVVVPVDTKIRVQVTAADVLHSWAVPAFGVKMDGIPGRLNELWFEAREEGTYYGQCSELCGIRHAFMPIMVRVVSKPEFEQWVAQAQEEYARAGGADRQVAQAGESAR